MKDETGCVVIEEFVGLKHKRYSLLVDKNEHKKAKGVNKNVGETIGHNEYKDLFLKYSPAPNNSSTTLLFFGFFAGPPPSLSYMEPPRLFNFPDFVLQIFQRLLKRIVLFGYGKLIF